MLDAPNDQKVYVTGSVALTRRWSDAAAVRLTRKVSISNGKSHTVWLVPDGFACIWFVNDSPSLSDKVISAVEVGKGARYETIEGDNLATDRPEWPMFIAVSMQTARNIMSG